MEKIDREMAASLLPQRRDESNKSDFGRVLSIAGSRNYRGAAYFSSVAPLRTGAGYVTLAGPEVALNDVSKAGVVTLPLKSRRGCVCGGSWKVIDRIVDGYDAVSIGCGLSLIRGIPSRLERFFLRVILSLRRKEIPVVIDADGINLIASVCMEGPDISLPKKAILTPHPGEMSRLARITVAQVQDRRVEIAQEIAQRFSAVVVLKGKETVVTDGTNVFINTTGSSALAKAGTGDVLTGIISGLCAQGLEPLAAGCLGVYLHGLAGEHAARDCTEYGVLAEDVLDNIPAAIHALL
ncbi:MAG TPA: NAD(P)H-hydrate dehydratase [Treponema sp.]|nr:NAD(P)H-hydrate dehydratase [Treponema sp.]